MSNGTAQPGTLIYAALVDGTVPWTLKPSDTVMCDELMEAFAGVGHPFDVIYTLLDIDLITTEQVDRLAHDDAQLVEFKPLIRRAYLAAVAQGRVPGRLN
jgi:hypothetical protein